jgi:hypothetical protein
MIQYMRIVDALPTGYRWANADETEAFTTGAQLPGAVLVRVGPDEEADITIPKEEA